MNKIDTQRHPGWHSRSVFGYSHLVPGLKPVEGMDVRERGEGAAIKMVELQPKFIHRCRMFVSNNFFLFVCSVLLSFFIFFTMPNAM